MLSENELLDIDGGLLLTAFLAAMAIGASVGANRKNRKYK